MEARKILIYLSMKHEGNWEQIYKDILDLTDKKEELSKEIESEYEKVCGKMNSKCITLLDDEYPETLKHSFNAPFVLYYHGDISLLNNKEKTLAVVGSRECSSQGRKDTIELVKGLCKKVTIVSGLARGIDSIAHQTAIENGGKTIAVLGSGINYIYPSENAELYEKIKKDHLVISELPDKTVPTKHTFPIRNRIIAFSANSVLIPEAKRKSGSAITANLVLNNNGQVCCVPTLRGNDSLCNYLIQEGACLVLTPEDILEQMNYREPQAIFK